jgi:membrane-associated phospholipid phosphatase
VSAPWPPWYEVGETVAIVVLGMLAATGLWLAADRRTAWAVGLRRLCGRRGVRRVCWAVTGACILFVVAEAVLDTTSGELLAGLNDAARRGALAAGAVTPVHAAARRASELTGIGLVITVAGVAACLGILGHRREALVVGAGSLSAWALSGALKLGFGVARPHSLHAGFPSGHVLVTVVGCGLISWSLGRFADRRARRWRHAAVAAAVLVAAVSRVLLDAHWLTDVVGGLAAGTVWLNVVLLVAAGVAPDEVSGTA